MVYTVARYRWTHFPANNPLTNRMPAKRVLIYSEYWRTRGGGEKYLLCIAEALLNAGWQVTIAAQEGAFEPEAYARYFNVAIEGATIHSVAGGIQALRREAELLSRNFDLCFVMTNYRYFHSNARQTFVILQIPYGPIGATTIAAHLMRGNVREAAKDLYRRVLLNRLRETYAVLVYSEFVRGTLDALHDIPSTVLPPPIDDFLIEGMQKERVILSVGRVFRGLYNDKRYDALIEAFKRLYAILPNTTWQYRIVGSCGPDRASQQYLDELRDAAKGYPIYFHLNAPYAELKRHYNEAALFWHAAGLEVDERKQPQRAEHFGMSTLEAMSTGCVPVVINRGGQKEIVYHGKSGYLWETLDELVAHSHTLIGDSTLRAAMQTEARRRFSDFSKEQFTQRLRSMLE